MPSLTDRQRIELAVPATLIYSLTGAPGVFAPSDPEHAARAESDIAELRGELRTACLEPFADLTPSKKQALMRRLERIRKQITSDWGDRSALAIMLMLYCFLTDLIEREVLILWEGSAMDRAMRKLVPMCEYGFKDPDVSAHAQEQAQALFVRLSGEGLYR